MRTRIGNMSPTKRVDNIQGWLSILPVLLVILLIRGYPIVFGIVKSFTNWDGLFKSDFIGLRNYARILGRAQFWKLLSTNVILLLFIPLQLFFGLVVSMLLYEEIPGTRFYRACYYLPQVLSALSIGYMFSIFFGLNGPINQLLETVGLMKEPVYWLGYRATALGVIIFCLVWINIGWQGMLFLGAMTQISPEIFEAARLDGAGYWTRTFKIMLPLLVPTVEYSCITSVMWCFTGLYSLIFSITAGGPGYDTTTIDYMIYLKAFRGNSEFGYACALSVILMLIVLVFTAIQMRVSRRADYRG